MIFRGIWKTMEKSIFFYIDISFDNKKEKLNKNHDKISQQVNVGIILTFFFVVSGNFFCIYSL